MACEFSRKYFALYQPSERLAESAKHPFSGQQSGQRQPITTGANVGTVVGDRNFALVVVNFVIKIAVVFRFIDGVEPNFPLIFFVPLNFPVAVRIFVVVFPTDFRLLTDIVLAFFVGGQTACANVDS